MHAYIYIYKFRVYVHKKEEVERKFSCIKLNKRKEKKSSVCK